uniref:Uncharacterized protein n=1 Tax=Arundo donax TaxID=35708 RepID=A0A0A9Q6F0_ARUDO
MRFLMFSIVSFFHYRVYISLFPRSIIQVMFDIPNFCSAL